MITRRATLAGGAGALAAVVAVQLEALGGRPPAAPEGLEAAEALAREVGVEPVAPALASEAALLEWAEAIELRQIGVYVDGAGRALEHALTQTLGTMLAAEAQHLAAVRDAQGRAPVHEAFQSGR